MLSNLASYLGYQLAPAELEPDVAEGVNVSAVEEDEWLLVERLDAEPDAEPAVSEAVGTSASALPGARSSMQESWYLTPPPSFSRGSVHMVTSPLENLLIEHPSMSVYHKSTKCGRRKLSNSSRSASDEDRFRTPSEENVRKTGNFNKLSSRGKYSKKTSVKRPPASSSDDALSLPSASEDDEKKDVKMKNFVKSPRRSLNSLKGLAKKANNFRRIDHSSSDEMISIPSNNEEDAPTVNNPQPLAPPKKLYSDVLRMKPKATEEVVKAIESLPAPSTQPELPVAEVVDITEVAGQSEVMLASGTGEMVVEESLVEKDRRRAVQMAPGQQRQAFLNRSAQKLEQRKTFELAKRSSLGRNNKAREINSRNKRQRRSDMMQRHSGVNNNRKCC